jgi:hypothetical protein
MKNILIFVVLLSITACASQTSKFNSATVTAQGSDEPNGLCQNFKPTNEEVQAFFAKAKQVSAMEIHNQYDYLPCYVKGTILRNDQTCDFSIRAGGTAELACNGEEITFYGCKTCDNLFKDKL